MTDRPTDPRPTDPRPAEPRGPAIDRQDRATIVKVILGVALLVIFVLFIIRNSRRVPVDFVFFSKQIRLVWVFLACALIGALIAWLIGRPRRRAQRRLIDEMERRR